MDEFTPKQIDNWRRVMSNMGMSTISSIVSDEEVKKFANWLQHLISEDLKDIETRQKQQAQRTIQESDRLRTEAKEPVSGFRNTVRIVKGK